MAPRLQNRGAILLYSWPKQCISTKIECTPSGHLISQRQNRTAREEIPPDVSSLTRLQSSCQEVSTSCCSSVPNRRAFRPARDVQIGRRRPSATKVD